MTFYISVKKYLPDNPLGLIMFGQLLYNLDKKLIGAYSFSGPTGLVYSTNGTIHVIDDLLLCFDITNEEQINKLDKWAKEKGYKMKIDIV